MNRNTIKMLTAVLVSGMLLSAGARAQEPPKMPYVFEMNCFLCHKNPERTGPVSIYDMRSKTGNPLHEQYIRNNVRFGMKAMPAFFPASILVPRGKFVAAEPLRPHRPWPRGLFPRRAHHLARVRRRHRRCCRRPCSRSRRTTSTCTPAGSR